MFLGANLIALAKNSILLSNMDSTFTFSKDQLLALPAKVRKQAKAVQVRRDGIQGTQYVFKDSVLDRADPEDELAFVQMEIDRAKKLVRKLKEKLDFAKDALEGAEERKDELEEAMDRRRKARRGSRQPRVVFDLGDGED